MTSRNDLSADLSLQTRTGLPDALRVLVEAYPRETWQSHKHFHGLVSFWLDRHMMFRRLLAKMTADTEAVLDKRTDMEGYRRDMARLGSTFVSELYGHHGIEDAHYFPVLAATERKVAQGFTLLDADHHALDDMLNQFVARANGVLQAKPSGFRAQAGAFHTDLVDLGGFLERHLLDEEDLVVPVILKHGPGRLG